MIDELDDELIQKAEKQDWSSYGKFHSDNIGYWWYDKRRDKHLDKAVIFAKFQEYPVMLNNFTLGIQVDYRRDKK